MLQNKTLTSSSAVSAALDPRRNFSRVCVIEKIFGTGLGGVFFLLPLSWPLSCAEWQGDFDLGLSSSPGVCSE